MRPEPPPPLLIVLSGPSGVGKDSVLDRLKRVGARLHFTVTATTRPKRPKERNGVEYFFITPEAFQEMAERDELLEKAQVYGNWYGVPKAQVREALAEGKDVIVRTDVQGAATIKSKAPQAVFIFLAPPSLKELERRLRERHTESEVEMRRRIRMARSEMDRLPMFDYLVINRNGELDEAATQVQAIIAVEKLRATPREVRL